MEQLAEFRFLPSPPEYSRRVMKPTKTSTSSQAMTDATTAAATGDAIRYCRSIRIASLRPPLVSSAIPPIDTHTGAPLAAATGRATHQADPLLEKLLKRVALDLASSVRHSAVAALRVSHGRAG